MISMWRSVCQVAGSTWARRGMCTESVQSSSDVREKKKQLPSMEAKLRQLYLRVHPDLFSSFPKAKETNGKSFQRLTEFLSTLKTGSTPTQQTSSQTFPMFFYMRPIAEKSAVSTDDDLEKVDITLRNSGTHLDKHKQLKLLFEACGLGGEFAMDAEAAGFLRNSLQGFLYDVAAEASQRKIHNGKEMREVIARQHMLHLNHNVRVTLSACKGSQDKCATLDKLLSYEVLDLIAKLNKASVHCIIGSRYGMDKRGGILLDKNGGIEDWCRHIATLQLHDIERSENSMAKLRETEARAAQQMGLQYIHAEETVEHTFEYLNLLSEIIGRGPQVEEGVSRGTSRGSFRRASGAVLLVQHDVPGDMGLHIEHERGTILAALSCDTDSLVGFVLDNGHKVARMRHTFMKQQRMLSDSLVEAKRALGITDLHVDSSVVSHSEAIECFRRLTHSAGTLDPPSGLRPLLQGVAICIGNEYHLKEDGTVVIPHDFEVSS